MPEQGLYKDDNHSQKLVLLRTDKNIAIKEAARNVKWARGTAAHAGQPDNKGENSATRQGENSATRHSS